MCEHMETQVLETRKMDEALPHRRRRCKQCDLVFWTIEVPLDDINSNKDVEKAWSLSGANYD